MTADEMFEKLGFKKSTNQVQIIYRCEDKDEGYSIATDVVFWLTSVENVMISYEEDGNPSESAYLDRGVAEAIALKCKELGWR